MPGLDQGTTPAHLSSPAGGADPPATAPSPPEPGLGTWKLVAQAGVASAETPWRDPGSSPPVLAAPDRIFTALGRPRDSGKSSAALSPAARLQRKGCLTSWKLLTKDELESIDPRSLDPNNFGFPQGIVPELVFQISDEAGKEEAHRTMGGHGALIMFLSRLKESELRGRWKELFGKRVTDRLFQAMPLFIPLFGAQSFQNVPEDEITAWLESFELYIGESVEDKGILVVARENLDVVIANLIKALPKPELEPEAEILRW
jgi:hypothetical protein